MSRRYFFDPGLKLRIGLAGLRGTVSSFAYGFAGFLEGVEEMPACFCFHLLEAGITRL